ncbi:aminopeptidase P family protein [Nakamurella flavida]|uniref:Aminopeptidase P family protein n=1 Tax=Nakamurella flavida TaxID=363630 RepID=A0A938YLB8_9ACTN|nr:aminopeptidase P family protein [Nakamurella flavida]MBM9475369.1 aminopeptidase P family protein [Nakamurella flavida]MDP9776949.1 Xaa-Pro dipeptidase [Nakamurella flavida]
MTTSAAAPADLTELYADRIRQLSGQARRAGADVVLISPGPDLAYFLGHSVSSHERLTCLVVPADGAAALLVPTLERPGWAGTPAEQLGLTIATWTDGEDPYRALAGLLPADARVLAVDYHMPAVHALNTRAAVPGSELTLAGEAIGQIRMRKSAAEIEALAAAGAAIDRTHARVGEFLRAGRSENEVAQDIAADIVAQGHARPDFVIVGSGPNGASPHHMASDRVIEPGDAVVVDIGGPMPSGYFSDCTRTYLVAGDGPADPDFPAVYEIVRRAQAAGVAAVRPGVPAQEIDRASRQVIVDAGYGEFFITRTGHGIGLEVHEHPYMVEGNETTLEAGMAFSVEPGIYLPGRFGVRIEDIVVVGDDGPLLMNNAPTALVTVG